ncbi:unnamed protein product [Gulo gulo]|uniref:Uncharacterized protein n=1 Tax=Gulo gulo TaxID=48420 RepID=A0A9X9Q6K5_GULGU|nr:unnamed protein product [Gulo gulo]
MLRKDHRHAKLKHKTIRMAKKKSKVSIINLQCKWEYRVMVTNGERKSLQA